MRILFCLLNFLSVVNFNSNFNQEEVIKNNQEVDDVVAVSDNSFVSICNDDSYFYYASEEYVLDNCVIYETLNTINNIYLLCNDDNNTLIYVFNKFSKNIDNIILENIEIKSLYDINNTLFLVGSSYNNGLILNLNYDLELINKRIFNSDGNILVNHLIFNDGYFYASIYKSGIANNSEFINHGNSLDMKSLIVQLDMDFNIINSHYFNENTSNEIVKNFYIEKDHLKILLKTNEGYYIYQLSKELSNLKYYYINSNNDLELFIHYKETNKDLLIDKTIHQLINVDTKKINDIYKITGFQLLCDVVLMNGFLYLYGIEEGLKVSKLSEYEVIKQEDKVLNYFNLDQKDTSNIKVESWFGNISIKLEAITPFFDKTISGTYNACYNIYLENVFITSLTVLLIVEEYTNFCDKGIYNINKTLEFFGTAKLNNEIIYYGTSIDEPGEYDVEITDVNGHIKTFHIYIVDNFYKDERVINTNTVCVYNDKAILELDLNNLLVKEIIVNDELFNNYIVVDNKLLIEFNKRNHNVESYYINGITFLSNNEEIYYEVNKQLTFNYLKNNPNITLNKTLESNEFKIECLVNDLDKTFNYLLAVSNSKKEIIYDKTSLSTSDVRLYFCYDVGDGNVEEILICEVIQEKEFQLNVKLLYNSGSLDSINIDIDVDEDSLKTLNVNNISFIDFYKKINNANYLYSIILISVVLFCAVCIIFIIFKIIKKRKQKVF